MTQAVQAPTTKVAFIGVGRMGAPMLKCVLDAGYHATLCDPSEQATAPFLASHPALVRVAPTPRQAAEGADVIDIVVNTNEQLLEACLGPDGVFAGAPPGSIVLVHSTVARDTLERLTSVARERGVYLLDAMVGGARGHMSVGNLAVMVGGDASAFARAKPIMETYGGLVLHLGPQGAGLDAKLALNMLRYLCMAASQEAFMLAEKAGVAGALAQLVAHTEANRFNGDVSRLKAIPLDSRRKEAQMSKKDMRAATARGAELGLQLPSARLAIDLMTRIWAVDES